MDDPLTRLWSDLIGRLTGPMTFRLILQPVMATIFACRDGMTDARTGQAPYLWTIFSDPQERSRLITDGWKHIGRVVILAILMDVAYQLIVFRWVYPGEVLVVAIVLAALPYALLRGLITRFARAWSVQ
jgi:hypothetical protein